MVRAVRWMCVALAFAGAAAARAAAPEWITIQGADGPGKGKHVVLVCGDDEYRSEELIPQMAKILAKHHGFTCTVLFPLDKDGTINPGASNIPGLENLAKADLCVMFLRFRNLPDEQMEHIVRYTDSGKPLIGMRTSTHAFNIPKGRAFHKYTWNNGDAAYFKGYGRQVFGETWVSHHGGHGRESTRGILAKEQANHPILKGIKDGDIWGPSDVYGVSLPKDCVSLVYGEVVAGMKPTDPPVVGKKNDPMMPIAWTRTLKTAGKDQRIFFSTCANGQDFDSEGLRRLFINATYWAVGLEDQIPAMSNVALVGEYKSPPFGTGKGKYRENVRPADHDLR